MSETLQEENSRLTELINRTHIRFPYTLTLKQAKSLINYVSIKLRANVNYYCSQKINAGNYHTGKEKFREKEITAEVRGRISLLSKSPVFKFFTFEHSPSDESKLSSIQFLFGKEEKLSDYKPRELQLFDNVRKATSDYFEENQEE